MQHFLFFFLSVSSFGWRDSSRFFSNLKISSNNSLILILFLADVSKYFTFHIFFNRFKIIIVEILLLLRIYFRRYLPQELLQFWLRLVFCQTLHHICFQPAVQASLPNFPWPTKENNVIDFYLFLCYVRILGVMSQEFTLSIVQVLEGVRDNRYISR